MNAHLNTIRGRFAAAAETYEEGSTVQQQAIEHLLPLLPPSAKRILEVGCGTGLLTRRLMVLYPEAYLEAMDLAPRMIHVAQQRTGHTPQVCWRIADAAAFHTKEPYDLMVSNCALHWLAPIAAAIRHLMSLLTPDGCLVFSIMLEGTLAELRDARLRVAPDNPPGLRLPDAPGLLEALHAAGARVEHWAEMDFEEIHPSAPAFLRHLHDRGLTGGGVSRGSRPLNRAEIRGVIEDYAQRCRTNDGGVFARYRAAFARARSSCLS